MAERDGHLREVLDGYAKFFQDKNLAMVKHHPYLVRPFTVANTRHLAG